MAQFGCTYRFTVPLMLGLFLTTFVFSDGAEDIQLVGGSLPNEGRIEMIFDGEKHNICSSQTAWTAAKSHVMCRQLGYAGHVTEKYNAYFGGGNWTLIHDSLSCAGDEEHIAECTSSREVKTDIKCTHQQDMSIICRLPGYLGCYSTDVNTSGQVSPEAVNVSLMSITPSNCTVACWKANMSYAIVMPTGCQCVESLLPGYIEANSDECTIPCPGSDLYVCGGLGTVDIYKTVDFICRDPDTPANGFRHGKRFFFGDEVTFSCQEGYSLIGATKTKCIVSSNNAVEWDNTTPLCNLDLVTTYPATDVNPTAYSEVPLLLTTIVNQVKTEQVPLTDFNDRTTKFTTSSDFISWSNSPSSSTNSFEHVISLTSLLEFPLSKNNDAVTLFTEMLTERTNVKTFSNGPFTESSTKNSPSTSEIILNEPTETGRTSPTSTLPLQEDPQMGLTTPDGEEMTSFTSSIVHTPTVAEELVTTESDLIQGDSVFRLILILGITVIVLVILLLIVVVIICTIWCRKDKPVFRVASNSESDVRSSFVFKRGSDSYKRFDQQQSSIRAKPDVVTMGTTFGHGDADASIHHHQNAVFVEPGCKPPSANDLSHPEAVKMFRESKGNMYNQFDFEVPREDEITEEEDLQFPSSFLEDDCMKQSTV